MRVISDIVGDSRGIVYLNAIPKNLILAARVICAMEENGDEWFRHIDSTLLHDIENFQIHRKR